MIISQTITKFMTVVVFVTGIFVANTESAHASESSQTPGNIELKHVLWQALPDHVRSVFVGPDDRVWYKLRKYQRPVKNPVVRQDIAEQFDKQSPQLSWAIPILFEPGGRVWFHPKYGSSALMGYDGKTWITKYCQTEHFIVGRLPNHGHLHSYGDNLFLQGTAFFAESHGVYTFRNDKWNYQSFTSIPRRERGTQWPYPSTILRAEPDGKGVLAYIIIKKKIELWRWRNGKWMELNLPPVFHQLDVCNIIPWYSGALLFTKDKRVFFHIPKNESEEDETIDPGTAKTHPGIVLGDYRIRQSVLSLYTTDGTAYITAGEVFKGEESIDPGIIVVSPKGEVRLLSGEGFARSWLSRPRRSSGALVVGDGSGLWSPGWLSPEPMPPRLIDLHTDKTVARLPEYANWIHATRKDGTLFAGRGASDQNAGPVMVYTPKAPDTREILTADRIALYGRGSFTVAEDGAVYILTPERELKVFDGNEWSHLVTLPYRAILHDSIQGVKGSLLVKFTGTAMLVHKSGIEQASSILALVSQHENMIRDLFPDGKNSHSLGIAIDKHGYIWLRDSHTLSVLVNGEWINITPLLEEEEGIQKGHVKYLAAGPSPERVYITTPSRLSFYAEIKNGEVLLSKAPYSDGLTSRNGNIRDEKGHLWFATARHSSHSHCMSSTGIVQTVKRVGVPHLRDEGGNIWFRNGNNGKRKNSFNVWRNDKIAYTVTIPAASEGSNFFSDRKGSVFVSTRTGLAHLVAKDPKKPAEFRVRKIYSFDHTKDHPIRFNYSRLGYILVTRQDRSNQSKQKYFLQMIPVPKYSEP